MITYALDYETYYDKDYGIEECGLYHYLHDKRFDPYLLSVVGENFQWVGHPKEFDWDKIKDADELIAHNSSYEIQVTERCVELGIAPEWMLTKRWYCTANLSVFLGGPRSLKDAAFFLLGREVSKEMRNYMKGKQWAEAVAEGKDEALKKYALDDSIHCYDLWKAYSHKWPEPERKAADITITQTRRGIAVDIALLDEALPKVIAARDDALSKIPWAGVTGENGDAIKPLSALAFKAWCKENGITPPSTTEARSPEFLKWQEAHQDVFVVKAMQVFRSANALSLKGTTLRNQVRPDGRYQFALKYFGSTTGRWSAGYEDERNDSSKWNIQNITKEEMYGLNLRKALIAGPGKKLIISDYSQIEPRCLAWLCNDNEFLEALKAGVPLYEAHARAQGSWKGEEKLKKADPKLYLQKKAEVLALGYGAGWAKFIFMCKMYGAEDCLFSPITESQKNSFIRYITRTRQQDKLADVITDEDWMKAVNAWRIVTDFRSSKTQITKLWRRLESDCKRSAGGTYEVELPSGRLLNYFNVRLAGGLTAQKTLHDAPIKIWGGFLTENITQATARDVMRDAIIRLEDEGITTLFTVHDEIVCEVDKNFDPKIIREIMNITPDWMPGLPLEIEQEETDYYKK